MGKETRGVELSESGTALTAENWAFPFGKWRGKTIAEVPSSYLDWVCGEDWFMSKYGQGVVTLIGKELDTRRRSGYKPQAEVDEEEEWDGTRIQY